jgi:putative endonuclease
LRNVRLGVDEADIVALDPDGPTLVLIEVKTRASARIDPVDSVDARKRHRLRRAAARLKSRMTDDVPIRIDVIAIIWEPGVPPQLRHYPSVDD